MQALIPEYLDLVQKANLGCEIEGEWPIKRLDRLADLLLSDSGAVSVKLRIGREEGVRFIRGRISARLQMTCQRCMQALDLALEAEVNLGMVTDESQADRLPEGCEPLVVSDEPMHLPSIVEDELLLALPLVPMHEADCSDYLRQQEQRLADEEDQAKAEKEKQSPFSVLKDLL